MNLAPKGDSVGILKAHKEQLVITIELNDLPSLKLESHAKLSSWLTVLSCVLHDNMEELIYCGLC
jgi:hypothetical protein